MRARSAALSARYPMPVAAMGTVLVSIALDRDRIAGAGSTPDPATAGGMPPRPEAASLANLFDSGCADAPVRLFKRAEHESERKTARYHIDRLRALGEQLDAVARRLDG